jgi:hypothetical protein
MCELFEAYGGADILDDDTQDSELSSLPHVELSVAVLPEPCSSHRFSEPAKPRLPSSTDDGEDTCDGMGGYSSLPYPGPLSPLKYLLITI